MSAWNNTVFEALKSLFKRKPRQAVPYRPVYIGNNQSGKYHRDDCEFAGMMRRGRRFLINQEVATDEGFTPCKACQPDRNPYKRGEWTPDFWDSSR